MKVIVAGSRSITDYNLVKMAIVEGIDHFVNTEPYLLGSITVISGHAKGVDQLGEQVAKEFTWETEIYPAEWEKYGKSAGYKRNVVMAQNADALIAIWDGESRGTKHMIDIANNNGLRVFTAFHPKSMKGVAYD